MRAGEQSYGPRVDIRLPSELEKQQANLMKMQAAAQEEELRMLAKKKERMDKVNTLYKVAYDSAKGEVDYDYVQNELYRRGWTEEANALVNTRSEIKKKAADADKEEAEARSSRSKADAMAAEQVVRSSVDKEGNIDPNLLVSEYQKKARELNMDPLLKDPAQISQALRSKRDYSKLEAFEYDKALRELTNKATIEAAKIAAGAEKSKAAFDAVAKSNSSRRQAVAEASTKAAKVRSLLYNVETMINAEGAIDTGRLAPLSNELRNYAREFNIPIDDTKLVTGEGLKKLHHQLVLATTSAEVKGPASDKDSQIMQDATVGLGTPKQVIELQNKALDARLKVETYVDTLFSRDIAIIDDMPPGSRSAEIDSMFRNTPILGYNQTDGMFTFWEYFDALRKKGLLKGNDEFEKTKYALEAWRSTYHSGEM